MFFLLLSNNCGWGELNPLKIEGGVNQRLLGKLKGVLTSNTTMSNNYHEYSVCVWTLNMTINATTNWSCVMWVLLVFCGCQFIIRHIRL